MGIKMFKPSLDLHGDKIISDYFDKDLIAYYRSHQIATDGAGVARVNALSEELLEELFSRKICAIHVSSYCSPSLARKAGSWILKNSKLTPWDVPGYDKPQRSDTAYSIGLPIQLGSMSKRATSRASSRANSLRRSCFLQRPRPRRSRAWQSRRRSASI